MVLHFRLDGCDTILTAAAGRGKPIHPWASAIITVFGSDGVASSEVDLTTMQYASFYSEPIRVPCLHVILAALIFG